MNAQNDNAMDFMAEELETRTEMQMLGFSLNPSIVNGRLIPVYDGETGELVAFV